MLFDPNNQVGATYSNGYWQTTFESSQSGLNQLDFNDLLSSATIANDTSGTSITLATPAALAAEGLSIVVADNQVYFATVAAEQLITQLLT